MPSYQTCSAAQFRTRGDCVVSDTVPATCSAVTPGVIGPASQDNEVAAGVAEGLGAHCRKGRGTAAEAMEVWTALHLTSKLHVT